MTVVIVAPDDLATYLEQEVTPDRAATAARAASGYLLGEINRDSWPVTWSNPGLIPEVIWSAALRLTAMLYENPGMLDSEQSGEVVTRWSKEQLASLVTQVRSWASRNPDATAPPGAAAGLLPSGRFPLAPAWPAEWSITEPALSVLAQHPLRDP